MEHHQSDLLQAKIARSLDAIHKGHRYNYTLKCKYHIYDTESPQFKKVHQFIMSRAKSRQRARKNYPIEKWEDCGITGFIRSMDHLYRNVPLKKKNTR